MSAVRNISIIQNILIEDCKLTIAEVGSDIWFSVKKIGSGDLVNKGMLIFPDNIKTTKDKIDYISKKQFTLKNNIPQVLGNRKIERTVDFGSTEIRLLKSITSLIWELFAKETKTLSRIPVDNDFPYINCYVSNAQDARAYAVIPSTLNIMFDIAQSGKNPLEKDANAASTLLETVGVDSRISLLKDFEIAEFRDVDAQLKSVQLSKITKASRLDPKKQIDRDHWAVTLVTMADRSNLNPLDALNPLRCAGHAEIIIESIVEGQHKIEFAHFSEPKNVEIGVNSIQHLDRLVRGKSETWIRSRKNVEEMVAEITKEASLFKAGAKPVLFGIAGQESRLSRPVLNLQTGGNGPVLQIPDNCITWALGKLEMLHIQFPKKDIQSIFTFPKLYTDPVPDRFFQAPLPPVQAPASSQIAPEPVEDEKEPWQAALSDHMEFGLLQLPLDIREEARKRLIHAQKVRNLVLANPLMAERLSERDAADLKLSADVCQLASTNMEIQAARTREMVRQKKAEIAQVKAKAKEEEAGCLIA